MAWEPSQSLHGIGEIVRTRQARDQSEAKRRKPRRLHQPAPVPAARSPDSRDKPPPSGTPQSPNESSSQLQPIALSAQITPSRCNDSASARGSSNDLGTDSSATRLPARTDAEGEPLEPKARSSSHFIMCDASNVEMGRQTSQIFPPCPERGDGSDARG